ncbi:unnamed protein product [Cyprideis torosa]|uniref:Adenylyltransferase and sulfurtransferase MOCS3 homolog n=1 Tax=Cyprideis torosa TaxID=163714 RepID=A0A7R8WBS0_9CRUS|nr:unnamed protein product [Cyprideis torosa]CAG0886751.1 unnamed protein product [Cyprideis torosa]
MESSLSLDNAEIQRYSRQLLVPEIGMSGQLKLKSSSVLIVGAGGLGCPAAQFLAAAGIGHLGILDYDDVEISNLHRQILHTEQRIGTSKSVSVQSSLEALNRKVKVTPIQTQLNRHNALDILKDFDVVLDASDNAATRYLINDACILVKKPLVSGSALRLEGQLTVYGYENGPCYRCIFPTPPPASMVNNCSEGGVLGVIPGIIGSLQALEAIKLLVPFGEPLSGVMLVVDGFDCQFRRIRLRKKSRTCAVCGENPTIRELIDYETFCGAGPNDKCQSLNLLSHSQRISVGVLQEMLTDKADNLLLIDVRPKVEFGICSLKESVNIPLPELNPEAVKGMAGTKEIVCICRRGNSSQEAVERLQGEGVKARDVVGGLSKWSEVIDQTFPTY